MNFGFVLFSLFVLMISSENVGSNINKLSLKCGQDGHKCSLLIAQVNFEWIYSQNQEIEWNSTVMFF